MRHDHLARRPRRCLRARRRDSEPARQARRHRRRPAQRGRPTRSRSPSPTSRGETRQGRIGVGCATLAALRGAPAARADADAARGRRRARPTSRPPPARARPPRAARTLRALFARATAAEQDFLVRLLVGELRQGALEGVMLDAIAAAAGVPAADVRRAAMVAGSLRATSRASRWPKAPPASRASPIALHRPVQPMLAHAGRRHRRRAGAGSAPRRSNGRSTARACRCTRRATRSRSTRAT